MNASPDGGRAGVMSALHTGGRFAETLRRCLVRRAEFDALVDEVRASSRGKGHCAWRRCRRSVVREPAWSRRPRQWSGTLRTIAADPRHGGMRIGGTRPSGNAPPRPRQSFTGRPRHGRWKNWSRRRACATLGIVSADFTVTETSSPERFLQAIRGGTHPKTSNNSSGIRRIPIDNFAHTHGRPALAAFRSLVRFRPCAVRSRPGSSP